MGIAQPVKLDHSGMNADVHAMDGKVRMNFYIGMPFKANFQIDLSVADALWLGGQIDLALEEIKRRAHAD